MAESNNDIPHLNLKFYPLGQEAVLPTSLNNNKGILAFDHTLGRIGANGKWFGDSSDKLPLVGGEMTGPIRWNNGANVSDASLVLCSKPVIMDEGTQTSDYRYLAKYTNGIELGNYHMYTRLLSWNSRGSATNTSGNTGDIWHYVSSTNSEHNSSISKYIMLDTRNSGISRNNSKPTGVYTLTMGYSTLDVLNSYGGVSLTFGTGSYAGQMTLSIGEASTTADIYAKYAITAGAAGSLSANTFYVNTTGVATSGQQDITFVPGNSSVNKIILGTGIVAKKVPAEGYSTIGANPKSFNIELSIDPSILARISALESRYDVTFTTNYE